MKIGKFENLGGFAPPPPETRSPPPPPRRKIFPATPLGIRFECRQRQMSRPPVMGSWRGGGQAPKISEYCLPFFAFSTVSHVCSVCITPILACAALPVGNFAEDSVPGHPVQANSQETYRFKCPSDKELWFEEHGPFMEIEVSVGFPTNHKGCRIVTSGFLSRC